MTAPLRDGDPLVFMNEPEQRHIRRGGRSLGL